ncbi:MAG TPA: hypothetical protein VHR45_10270 [Thermoanaerobaculia bacterium]|nr:hypothetical protein [Thermoanaerobaculia bacterium]
MRQGASTAAAGVAAGLLLAYAAGLSLQALLAGIEPGDAPTFAAAAGLCLLVTISGRLLPALRAVRVDPVEVLRAE